MKGICAICGNKKELLKHHKSYNPEDTVKLCSSCHAKVHWDPSFCPQYAPIEKRPQGFQYKNEGTVRISIDVTGGTFNKLEELCNEEFQNKAEVLRECLNNRFKEEGNKK